MFVIHKYFYGISSQSSEFISHLLMTTEAFICLFLVKDFDDCLHHIKRLFLVFYLMVRSVSMQVTLQDKRSEVRVLRLSGWMLVSCRWPGHHSLDRPTPPYHVFNQLPFASTTNKPLLQLKCTPIIRMIKYLSQVGMFVKVGWVKNCGCPLEFVEDWRSFLPPNQVSSP